ncbi:protein lifeguard 1 [Alosa sapidissima]|uniref:protein lifeguard 1 n=1 Tax=Alosa sapidissima TaxID=34773 RepID=UPI001C0823DC|nr:protein lifeguard 1 [Alosa sapidissima]XP_041962156.1 protein lifeguard 1 [Alosa sapidissima]XP_041962157.1 protein lifeguard 1 [Alosa sapidissima]XP_041962158.1 protein lifeguard 1 [Alosa sapidissima]XP_041962159.1 protein lifeguard 1 [Alosa sapidissima]
MATDSTNNTYSQYPPAQYGNYGNGNTSVVPPKITPGGHDNQAYDMPPEYGHWNNDSRGNICVVTLEGPENQAPPPDYDQVSEETNCFSDASIRRGFVRKVYFTLTIQLLITVGIICAFLYWHDLKIWTLKTSWFPLAMMPATFVLIMVLACCGEIRRKVPLNFIFLGLFTIVEGLMLGSVTVYYSAEAVLWAAGATAFVCFTLTLFAMQTKWDFTRCSGLLWALAWSLISFGILCAIFRSQYLNIVYACLGTSVFSAYLVMDTQLMLGGKHKYSLDPEEYVFAALNLYLDIVTLFLLLLQLIGLCR